MANAERWKVVFRKTQDEADEQDCKGEIDITETNMKSE